MARRRPGRHGARRCLIAATIAVGPSIAAWGVAGQAVISFEYEPVDSSAVVPLREYVEEGRDRIEAFFGRPFAESFVFRVVPSRDAYDRHAAEKWGMTQTACWMVGGAEDAGVVLVSPRLWSTACDHDPADARHVRDLVVHELVHVYHMQHNPSTEFEGADEIGWLVEGLATYASGQLEHAHAERAREAVETGAVPARLADAWSGPYRYGVSGSLVAYVDGRIGRAGLVELLGATTQAEILDRLGMTEQELLAEWAAWVRGG